MVFIDTSLMTAFPIPDPDLPRLTHPSKARPKSHKQHVAKRPLIASESLLIETAAGRDEGLDAFFSNATQAESVKQKPVASQRRFHARLPFLCSKICYAYL